MKEGYENIKEKIAALLKKTMENGASESESMQAIQMAKKLMAKYGITIEDIKTRNINANDYGMMTSDKINKKTISIFDSIICDKIAEYTSTKCFVYVYGKYNSKNAFFGHRVDVELAIFMQEVCLTFLNNSWNMFKETLPKNSRAKQRVAYSVGMAEKIAERIDALIGDEKKAEENSGTNLIVLKNQITLSMFEEFANDMERGMKKPPTVYNYTKEAYDQGYVDGDKVSLHKNMGESEKVMMIENMC